MYLLSNESVVYLLLGPHECGSRMLEGNAGSQRNEKKATWCKKIGVVLFRYDPPLGTVVEMRKTPPPASYKYEMACVRWELLGVEFLHDFNYMIPPRTNCNDW